MRTRPLIIGASGQVGAQLAKRLGNEALKTARVPKLSGWVQLDLAQLANDENRCSRLLRENDISVVYCAGAMTYVDGCEVDPVGARQTNCEGPATLARAAARCGCRFVFFSTDYVFDGSSGPYDEEAPMNPINAYGESKRCGEIAVQENCPEALIIRTTGVFGHDDRGKNFLYQLRNALQANQAMRVPSDQFATPTYNGDLAKAVTTLVDIGAAGVFNVCGPDYVSRIEFARRAAHIMNLDSTLLVGVSTEELAQPAKRPLRAGLKIDKLERVTGLRMRNVQEAVQDWLIRESA